MRLVPKPEADPDPEDDPRASSDILRARIFQMKEGAKDLREQVAAAEFRKKHYEAVLWRIIDQRHDGRIEFSEAQMNADVLGPVLLSAIPGGVAFTAMNVEKEAAACRAETGL